MDDTLVMQSDQAANLFGLSQRDIGQPIRELEVSYQPLPLRSQLDQVLAERKPVRISEVEFGRPGGVVHWFELHLNPVIDGSELLGISVVFHDVSATRSLRVELDRANRQLESTNNELQSTNEELETTNEELLSTVEELETTNEELQSTKEELETMNEELQSANDELEIINEALRERSTELNDVNDFLESVMTAITAGIIVVDLEMRVLRPCVRHRGPAGCGQPARSADQSQAGLQCAPQPGRSTARRPAVDGVGRVVRRVDQGPRNKVILALP